MAEMEEKQKRLLIFQKNIYFYFIDYANAYDCKLKRRVKKLA